MVHSPPMADGTPITRSEYSLLDYGRLLVKRWPWVLLPLLALSALGFLYGASQSDRYQATATVLVADTASQQALDPTSQNAGIRSRDLSNEILLAESSSVEVLVEEQLGLVPNLDIESASGADALLFVATASSADAAALHANTWAEMFVRTKQDEAVENIAAASVGLTNRLESLRTQRQQIGVDIAQLEAQLPSDPEAGTNADLQRQIDELRSELELVEARVRSTTANLTDLELQAELAAVGEARIIQVAAPPRVTSNTPLYLYVAMGILLGLAAGFGLALLIETLDKTIKTPADVNAAVDVSVLASIPKVSRKMEKSLAIATSNDPEGLPANAYHKVRSSIEFASLGKSVASILVTSANAGEGKSTTSSNLALALASVGRHTVLVDLDFRRARIHEIYGVPQAPGLSDFCLATADLPHIAYPVPLEGIVEMRVIPTGSVPPSPAAFIGTEALQTALVNIGSQTEAIVLDSPPLLAVPDALSLAQNIDAVVLTARAGETTKDDLREVVTMLRQVEADVLGVVLIGVDENDSYGANYY